jgi:hypothetical protein
MKNTTTIIITFIAFFAVACSSAHKKTNYLAEEQTQSYDRSSVSHWGVGGNQGR